MTNKVKRNLILVLVSVMSVLCLGLFGAPKMTAYAAELETKDSYYLYDDTQDNDAYKSAVVAGKTTGYDKYELTKPASISTKANMGFEIKGWLLTYTLTGAASSTTEFVTDDKVITDAGQTVNINITYTDTDYDNKYDSSTLNINPVFADMIVEPVFDYIYYSVELGNVIDFIDLTKYTVDTIDADVLYHSEGSYTDSILKTNDKYYYVGDITKTGPEYTTAHGRELSQYAFRYNEEIDLSLDIDDEGGKYIQTNDFSVETIDITTGVGPLVESKIENEVGKTITNHQDVYYTTDVVLDFSIKNSDNQNNLLKMVYTQLYTLTLNPQIITRYKNAHENGDDTIHANVYELDNGTTFVIDGNGIREDIEFADIQGHRIEKDDLVSVDTLKTLVTLGDAFYKIDAGTYLVCAGATPTISVNNYTELSANDGKLYTFYDHILTNNGYEISSLNEDRVIDIYYAPTIYTVEYEFRVYNAGNLSDIGDDYNVLGTEYYKRGQSKTLEKLQAPENIGYSFRGYFKNSSEINSIAISNEQPSNQQVLMAYVPITYQVHIQDMTYDTTLNNGAVDIRALNELVVTKNNISQSYNADYGVATKVADIQIGDRFSLEAVVNTGFVFDKFMIDANEYGNKTEFVLDENLISYTTGDAVRVLLIKSYELYKTYQFNYFIDKSILINQGTEGETEYLMAKISVDNIPAHASVERKDIDGNTIAVADTTTLAQRIIISGLHLYDKFDLNSTPLELDGQPGVYYMYHNFAAGNAGIAQLADVVDLINRKYSHQPTINEGVGSYLEAKVIYSLPMTGLTISGYQGILPGVVVSYENGSTIEKDPQFQIDTYNFTVDEHTGIANIRLVFDLNDIAFGYLYSGYSFGYYEPTSYVDGADGVIALTVASGRMYRLEFNFDLEEYELNLTNNLDSSTLTDTLTVEDMRLEIDKPKGYYISKFTYDGVEIESGYALNETNALNTALNNDIYRRSFASVNTFKNFINSYDLDGDNEITLNIVYEIYKYSVKVEFTIYEPKNSLFEDIMSYPGLSAVCTLGGEDVTLIRSTETKRVTYSAVPYGSDLDISVDMTNMFGFDFNRWIADFTGNRDGIELANINNNHILQYELKYVDYKLLLQVINSEEGSPKVKVNDYTYKDEENYYIRIFDRLRISANPNTDDGFTFRKMYVDYKYIDDTTFREEYFQLYVRDDETGIYRLNASDTYDDTLHYVRALETDNGIYEESNFDASRYDLTEDREIYVYLDYDLKRMTFVPVYSFTGDDLEGGTVLRPGEENELNTSINISIDDVAKFRVFATSTMTGSDGREREILTNDTVNYYDNIRIMIVLNDEAVDQISGIKYNLKDHVILSRNIKMLGKSLGLKNKGNGVYEVNTTMKSLMKKNAASIPDAIEVTYTYTLNTILLELTTNIGDASFYTNINMDITLSGYGYGFKNESNSGALLARSTDLPYLGAAMMSYQWNNNYAEYFKIYRVNVYLDGEWLDPESQEYRNMVHPTYNDDDSIMMIEFVRIFGDIKVELMMQPIITIKQGNEYVVVTDETYIIPKVFICDNTATALAQSIVVGESSSNDADVKMAKIVADAIENIEYRDESNMLTIPKNVGTYTAIIRFKSSDQYTWLAELNGKLLCTIKLQITPKVLSVTYDPTKVVKEEKTYDQSHAYENMKGLTNYLLFEFTDNTGSKVSMPYHSGVFRLDSTNFTKMANITHTVDGVEDNIALANELKYYNVFIKNMVLSNNTNFQLVNSELIIYDIIKINRRLLTIEGLEVNDKVYDSTTNATLADSEITLSNIVGSDDVSLNKSKVSLSFADSNVGRNKIVNIDPTLALKGLQSSNYKLNTMQISTATIYPYSVSMEVDGIGLITIRNDRGLLDSQYAGLIPVDARLTVSIITDSHAEYDDIYDKISSNLSRMKVYGYAYKLQLDVMGNYRDIDNHLYLVMPKPENMSEILWVNSDTSGTLSFDTEEEPIIIDLVDVEGSIRYAVVIEYRNLLTWWQILLIVLLVVIVVGLVVTIFLVIRRKKIREYELKEKI